MKKCQNNLIQNKRRRNFLAWGIHDAIFLGNKQNPNEPNGLYTLRSVNNFQQKETNPMTSIFYESKKIDYIVLYTFGRKCKPQDDQTSIISNGGKMTMYKCH